jgi:hypothetical protein
MKIKWDEPKAIFRHRWKEKIMKTIRSTAWLRVGVWLLIVLPLCVYFLEQNYPSRDFHWYYLPVIIIIVVLYMTLLAVIDFYISKSTVSIDNEGIRLGGTDGRIRKYLFQKITSIEVLPNHDGNYSLSWQYENKNIIRGISQEIDITKIKTLIENNSNLGLKIKQP